jgi:hypothetical protein
MSNQPLADAVHNWIHFDNLCTNLTKQMTTARNLRNNYEQQVLSLIGKTKRLRIKGAYLEPATKNNSVTLNDSLTFLGELSLGTRTTNTHKEQETQQRGTDRCRQ